VRSRSFTGVDVIRVSMSPTSDPLQWCARNLFVVLFASHRPPFLFDRGAYMHPIF
jgi:hypothetical protein